MIDLLFEAVKPDFVHRPPSAWEKAKADTLEMEHFWSGAFGHGMMVIQPIGNAGAPGADWVCAVACSPEGVEIKAEDREAPPVRLVALTLNPTQPRGIYLHRLRDITTLSIHTPDLVGAQSAEDFLTRLRQIELVRFGTWEDRYTIMLRRMRELFRKQPDGRQVAHAEAILKQSPSLLEFWTKSEFLVAENEADGYWFRFDDGQVCPVDRAMLWYFDSWLELADGRKGFPAQELTEAERAEVLKLRGARILSEGNSKPLHSVPAPFQCFEGHLLWRDPDGGIRVRTDASVVDKTAAYAEERLGLPRRILA